MDKIIVRQAVKNAMEFLGSVQEAKPPEEVTVEEVELSEDGEFWLITISFYPPGSSLDAIIQDKKPLKNYKLFKIDAFSGDVISMKMREV